MMWNDLLTAIALLLIIEGVMPFISPESLRNTLRIILEMNDHSLRIAGFVSMIAGLILLHLLR